MRFDDYVRRLGRALHGDGWRCVSVHPLADGSLAFRIDAGARRPHTVMLKARERRGDGPVETHVSVDEPPPPAPVLAAFAAALADFRAREDHPLMAWAGTDIAEITLARGAALPRIWEGHFRPRGLLWGPFELGKVDVQDGAVYLRFAGELGSADIRITATDDRRIEPQARVHRTGAIAVAAVPLAGASEASREADALARFVAYVVAHNSGADTRIRAGKRAAPAAPRWGRRSAADQFVPEGRQGASGMMAALFGTPADIFVVTYGDASCRATFPYGRDLEFFNRWSYFPVRQRHAPGRFIGIDFTEQEMVGGAEERLRVLLSSLRERAPATPVVIIQTCVSRLIGEDVRGVIDEVYGEEAHRVGVLSPDFGTRDRAVDSVLWEWLFDTVVGPPRAPEGDRSVNLVGYGDRDSRSTRELIGLLGQFDIDVGGVLFPWFDNDELGRFAAAVTTVASPCTIVRSAFSQVRGRYGERWTEPPAPFGVEGTHAWAGSVLKTLGLSDRVAELDALAAAHGEQLAVGRAALAGRRCVLTARGPFASYLFQPSEVFGIPVVDLLAELGVEAHVHILDDGPAPRELARLDGRAPAVRLFRHDDEEALRTAIADSGADFLLTSLDRNDFAVEMGMLPIHASIFEMGFEGAHRTQRKLGRLADSGFVDMCRRYGGGAPD